MAPDGLDTSSGSMMTDLLLRMFTQLCSSRLVRCCAESKAYDIHSFSKTAGPVLIWYLVLLIVSTQRTATLLGMFKQSDKVFRHLKDFQHLYLSVLGTCSSTLIGFFNSLNLVMQIEFS
jgi:hypothetical protein